MFNLFKSESSNKKNDLIFKKYQEMLNTDTKNMNKNERNKHFRKLCDLSIKLCPIKF